MIASNELSIGLVMNCLFAVIISTFSLSQVAPRIETFSKATAAAQKIFQTIYRIPSIDSLSDQGDRPKDIEGDIEFRNVSFIYPSRPEGLLSLIHADISHGTKEHFFINSRGKIHSNRWCKRIWKEYNHSTS
jgi:ABC-type multidrug transport system fused ATPase/permease subunit